MHYLPILNDFKILEKIQLDLTFLKSFFVYNIFVSKITVFEVKTRILGLAFVKPQVSLALKFSQNNAKIAATEPGQMNNPPKNAMSSTTFLDVNKSIFFSLLLILILQNMFIDAWGLHLFP